jgi:hypothetical protein
MSLKWLQKRTRESAAKALQEGGGRGMRWWRALDYRRLEVFLREVCVDAKGEARLQRLVVVEELKLGMSTCSEYAWL